MFGGARCDPVRCGCECDVDLDRRLFYVECEIVV